MATPQSVMPQCPSLAKFQKAPTITAIAGVVAIVALEASLLMQG